MPKWGSLKGGKEAENYWNGRLVEALHKAGFPSAGFERIFTVRKEGKDAPSKPDVSLANGGVHIVSGKFGARKELEAYRSADEYKEDIGPALKRRGEKLGEVFAVTYPSSRFEKLHLHILPREGHQELSFTLETVEDVANQIAATVKGLIAELERRQEPVLDEARRLLRWGADDLATTLKGVGLTELEMIFGGHDFFQSLLRPRLKGEKRTSALRLGAAYLFVNQVLFYVLLSEAAERAGEDERKLYPRIKPEHFSVPKVLHGTYFERVRSRNYESIYGFEVAQFFKGDAAEEACESLLRGIIGLAPKLAVPDLMGQIFQTLIPLEIRKPLGAHYTNPRAAALLAQLSVRTARDTILDPACGSGTLLVAAYRRKKELAGDADPKELHHEFVETDITGIDAMGFVAHLAAVNLAVQQPLVETDHVRIGTADSTSKRPGEDLTPTEASLPREFQQANLEHTFAVKRPGKRRGVVQTSRREARSFRLESVDLVIMNPPFTSWDNMGESYREALKKSYQQDKREYKDALHWKVSQQAFFILLADRFLKSGGTIAAVLPITTFTGQAFLPLLRLLLRKYTVKAVVLSLGRMAFSEDTSLGECLFIAEKRTPSPDSSFLLMGIEKSPDEWTTEDMAAIFQSANQREDTPGLVRVREHPQTALLPDHETLAGLMLRLQPEYAAARKELDAILDGARVPLVPFESTGITLKRWILGGGWLEHYGSKALFGYRGENRAIKETDRLIYENDESSSVVLRDRIGGHVYKYPKSRTVPALRRFSYVPSFDVTLHTDVAVAEFDEELRVILTALYGKSSAEKYLGRMSKTVRKTAGGRWSALVRKGMTTLAFAGRLNWAAPGTTVICCRSEKPILLAAYGFMVKGFRDTRVEKLTCLWFNSTPFLLQLMDKLTITGGTWVRMEEYVLYPLRFPDTTAFSERDWTLVEELYDALKNLQWPSLVEQLKDHQIRRDLDDGMLRLLGIEDARRREQIGRTIRRGVEVAINALQETMRKRSKVDDLPFPLLQESQT